MELHELCYYEPHPERDRRVSVLGSDNLPEIIVLGGREKVEEVQRAVSGWSKALSIIKEVSEFLPPYHHHENDPTADEGWDSPDSAELWETIQRFLKEQG